MSAVRIAPPHSQTDGRRKNSKTMSAEVSPDSKCPICLDKFNNVSHLDRCLHKFCFRCILEWSKNKAECPLCKQPFRSIYHTIKSDEDFQKYEVKQHVDNSSFGYFEGVRFRYRTTLTGIHRQMRRTSPPPDNGVIFEASINPPQQRQDGYMRRMMQRLEAKRRAEREGRAVTNVREQEMINFRRELYRRGARVRSVRDGGLSRDTSVEFYQRNPACLHRLVPWLKRELMVLYGAHGSLVNIVQHIIMSRITRYDMEDGAIQEELRPFLQGRTEHFLHEFISFARSPFNMEAYDQHAVYDCPAPSSSEDGSSNSSVIAISEDEDNSAEMGRPEDATSALSHSVWDDETPGPSYSTGAEQSGAERLSVLDLDSESSSEEERQESEASPQQVRTPNQADLPTSDHDDEGCASLDSDDCVIVGFVKPTAERTPELVQLSSDSDESAFEDIKEVPLQPYHIRFTSCSPAPTQRSDSSRQTENVETDRLHGLESKDGCSSSVSSKSKKSRNSQTDKDHRRRHKSKDGDRRRERRRSKSGERRHSSRSPVSSNSIVSCHSSETACSHSHGKDFSKCDPVYRRRDRDHCYQSYSHYRREKHGGVTHFTHRRSYYFSSRRYSRSRSRSRDSQRQRRRWSRSRSSSSSRSPSTKRRPHHKPGGKHKYKTRHLEDSSTHLPLNPNEEGDSVSSTKHKKKSKEKRRKKSKKSGGVELAREDKERDRGKHHKKKKKHKKSKKHKTTEQKSKASSTVITIDSGSDSGTKHEHVPLVSSWDGNDITDERANPRPED
ncbi:topoisomerase I binding, arginine/serine-rich a [Nematolebias whitei]|uniref:topoisomerase I binding, arginine/serine-rich a n=1 Tax=Nematolebias whitei TaxID=451745 RepID=UPI001899788A|nr:topoisomerase I binding, arginine/serine-rich a [Nematolebias whitei]